MTLIDTDPTPGQETPNEKSRGIKDNLDRYFEGKRQDFRLYLPFDLNPEGASEEHKELEDAFLKLLGEGYANKPIGPEPTPIYKHTESGLSLYRWANNFDFNGQPLEAWYVAAPNVDSLAPYTKRAEI